MAFVFDKRLAVPEYKVLIREDDTFYYFKRDGSDVLYYGEKSFYKKVDFIQLNLF